MTGEARSQPDDLREWLERARSSLSIAAARADGACLDDLCWQAQEAAEKAIKAVMIARDVRYPYVHDLEILLSVLESAGFAVAPEVRRAAKHAAFGSRRRYPGKRPITERGYRRRLSAARRVVEWAAHELATGGTGAVRENAAMSYTVRTATAAAASAAVSFTRNTSGGAPSQELLAELVHRILGAVQPERIMLFGSAARGTMGPYSDLDIMVVMAELPDEEEDEDALEETIHDALLDLLMPVDIVLATPEILERYGRSWCLVYCPALEEGRVLYERRRGTARVGRVPARGTARVAGQVPA